MSDHYDWLTRVVLEDLVGVILKIPTASILLLILAVIGIIIAIYLLRKG